MPMKSKLRVSTLREIKGTFGRFMAILAIIALGVGFFSGVKITTDAMINTVGSFMNEQQLFDYRLVSTMGWDEDSAAAFRSHDDVRSAEGAYSLDVIFDTAGDTGLVFKTHSLTEGVNEPSLLEGRMPKDSTECLMDAKTRFQVGDKLKLSIKNPIDTLNSFLPRELTVVGRIYSPYYVHFERGSTSLGNGTVNGFIYLDKSAFDMQAYSEIFVKLDHDMTIYSDEYKDYISDKEDEWQALADTQAEERYNRIIEEKSAQLEEGRKKLEDLRKKSEKGAGSNIFASVDEQIEQGEKRLSDGEAALKALKKPQVFLLGRNTNIGYACFENDSQIVAQVARVFPIFFILVAALVCMTTMSRMVEERRTQIGTLKALGYSERAIMGKFTFYAGSAAVIGCVLGYGVGTNLFPRVIWMTYKLMYIKLDMKYVFGWRLAAISGAVALICSVGAAWLSCRYELGETAAGLMRPKAPRAGKRVLLERVPFIWNRMKFLHKVSVRNIFRYKKRFFMMIAGISGCTALLLTGFGLKDSVAGFAEAQYDEIITADASLTHITQNGTMPDTLRETLESLNAKYSQVYSGSWDLVKKDLNKGISLVAPEDFDSLKGSVNFMDTDGKALEAPTGDEAFVSVSISERCNVKVGDEITLRDEDMREMKFRVKAVFDNHVYNYVFVPHEAMERQLGGQVDLNEAFIKFPKGTDISQAQTALSGMSEVTNLTLYKDLKKRLTDSMSSLDYVVLLVIISAAGLAFIVLYNLTNINITEREREIATIKVLGFFKSETSAYVLRENLVLTALGIGLGLGLGVLLHRFVMAQIVVDMVSFKVKILPISFLYSVLLTFLFDIAVDLFMGRKLEKINMAESLKSVE